MIYRDCHRDKERSRTLILAFTDPHHALVTLLVFSLLSTLLFLATAKRGEIYQIIRQSPAGLAALPIVLPIVHLQAFSRRALCGKDLERIPVHYN